MRIVNEKRSLLNVIENRRGKIIGHLLRHGDLGKIIIEGKTEGRRKRGRPRKTYMEQLKEKVEVVTYRELKEKAGNRPEWKLLHRQEPR